MSRSPATSLARSPRCDDRRCGAVRRQIWRWRSDRPATVRGKGNVAWPKSRRACRALRGLNELPVSWQKSCKYKMTTLSDNSGDAVRYDAPSQSSRRDAPHARLNGRAGLRGELALGRQELSARFRSSPPRILGSRELLVAAVGSRDVIYHLRA